MFRCKILIIASMLLPFQAIALDDKPRGWLWYQDPVQEVKKEKKAENPTVDSSSQPSKPKTAVEEMSSNRKQYDEAMAKAILYPTLENVTRARHIHDAIIAQAGEFQQSWTISELLDQQSVVDVTSPGALKISRKEEEKALDNSLKELSKSYGLIFVFKEDCPYCHQFAPVIKEFANEYGFKIEGLSAGEGCFEGMVCSKNARAVSNINPDGAYPLLYLANPSTNDLIPVAKGFISQSALLENMKYALKFLKQQGSPS